MSVEKRRGRWAYRFSHNGEPHFKGGFPTAGEAEKAEKQKRLELADPNTVAKLIERRLDQVKAYCSKQHLVDTRAMLARFNAVWGHLPVSLVTKKMVHDLVLDLSKHLSNNNVNRHIKAAKTLFEMAVDEDLIHKNPVRGVKFLPHARKQRVVPTVADVREVLLKAGPEEQAYITVIWLTAARVNEINRLAWENIDFEKGVLHLSTRKSKGGDEVWRKVPMVPQVVSALKYMWRNRVPGSPWVFNNPTSVKKSNDPNEWRYKYRSKLLKGLGAPFNYHHLRHSTASILADLGVELPIIQKILGHANLMTTMIYIQDMPGGVAAGMETLGKFYAQQS